MSDEDEIFASIVREEFDEQWTPPPAPHEPAATPPLPPVAPQPDFQLNLFDDDESYREVRKAALAITPTMTWGLILVGVGLLITIARFLPLGVPLWFGWVAIASFIAGASLCLWHLTHATAKPDDEGEV